MYFCFRNLKSVEQFDKVKIVIQRGDFVGVRGHAGKTAWGNKAHLMTDDIFLLAPNGHAIPNMDRWVCTTYRKKYLLENVL